jgi:hypothetical protein
MKLIKRVQELEANERVERAQTAGVGLAWTTHEQLAGDDVDADEIATDIHIVGSIGGTDEWRTVERRRRDAEDLGDVFDEAGVRIGRVTIRDGSFVRWTQVEGED